MASDRQCFCKKIGKIYQDRIKRDQKLTLQDAVLQPAEAHVDGLRHFWRHGLHRDADGALIIAEQHCRWLRVPHIPQDRPLFGGNARGGEEPWYSASKADKITTGLRVEWKFRERHDG